MDSLETQLGEEQDKLQNYEQQVESAKRRRTEAKQAWDKSKSDLEPFTKRGPSEDTVQNAKRRRH